MVDEIHKTPATGRREFLTQLSAVAAGSGLVLGATTRAEEPKPEPAPLLPTIQVGEHRLTRLAAGWNPMGGYSYLGPHLDQHMREYFTPEGIVEFLEKCEREGINAHQFSSPEQSAPILRTLRERGSKMKFICLDASGTQEAIKKVVEETSPIAMVHHGGVTDKLFREGKSQAVHDFVKQSHDAGVLAGVSAHNPDAIKQVADEGWEVDLFMCCFYYLTRTPEELEKMPPVVTEQIGYSFFASDPARMTEVMRQVDQPCLGFKILAAGRKCHHKHLVDEAFKFAFKHVKPNDGVLVGMYPRFHDEIRANAEYTRQFGSSAET
ncbi:MAG: hypothetical protein ABIK89_17660 [Planctomycetota bacterium]